MAAGLFMMLVMLLLIVFATLIIYGWSAAAKSRRATQQARYLASARRKAVKNKIFQRYILQGREFDAALAYHNLTTVRFEEALEIVKYLIAHPEELATRAAKKKKVPPSNQQDAGLRDLVQAGKLEEAAEVYRQFAGVDEYTARDYVTTIAGEMETEPPAENEPQKIDQPQTAQKK